MRFFGKKKEEEVEEDDLLEQQEERKTTLENKRLKKKLKDLSPENKKNRKEPTKPWGKKERIIVGSFFTFTTLAATLMFLYSHNFKFPGLPMITIKGINFARPFGEEVIQIGQKNMLANDDTKSKEVVDKFNSRITPLSGHYGFLVIRLNSGERYGVSSNSDFQGASLLKLPLMTLVYKMSEEGKLDLDSEYVLKTSDKVKGSGVLYGAKPGTIYTYRKLTEFMGKNSDRTAYNVMKEIVGEPVLKSYVQEVGMLSTNTETGVTTPSDLGLLLQKLWSGEMVNATDRDEILGYLTNTDYEDWIPAGIPKNIVVAHKFGQDQGVVADGGIIKTQNPYILIIMGEGITKQEGDNLLPAVSKDVYSAEVGD